MQGGSRASTGVCCKLRLTSSIGPGWDTAYAAILAEVQAYILYKSYNSDRYLLPIFLWLHFSDEALVA